MNIFADHDNPLRERVIEFWDNNGVLERDEAAHRSGEIVFVIMDANDEIAGVSTAYPDSFRSPGDFYYFYRMYIAPAHRVYGMMEFITDKTRDFLHEWKDKYMDRTSGVVIITENPKLMRPGIKRRLRHIGFQHAGKNPKGLDIWVSEF
ncbi:MAG: hypothetical protein P8126_10705 [Gammaproteobacteria bacterium]